MFGIFRNNKTYAQKAFYTFCPRFIFKLDPYKNREKDHWSSQGPGDPHGYDKYENLNSAHTSTLFKEIDARMAKDEPMLDLGCNCGYTLSELKKRGYKNLCGVDICGSAIEHGKKIYDLNGIELDVGSYESVLPKFVDEKRKFCMVFSGGASISLVHPSFDIVKYVCSISRKYVVFVDEDSLGLPYPRLWEYEFYRNGFTLVKFLRPSDGSICESGKNDASSIAVYQRTGEE